MIRLIATDLDGTLLNSRHRIPARNLLALREAHEAGVLVVPASGRQPFSIEEVVRDTFLADGVVLGANGAVGYHLGTGEVLFEDTIAVEAQRALFFGLQELYPTVRCVSVRDAGATFLPQRGYVGLMDPGDHGRRGDVSEFDLDDVLADGTSKLVIRGSDVAPDELLAAARDLAVPGCTPTTSGAPFLEVAAEGVNKATGVARIADRYGIAPEEIVAFGDNENDVELLAWAGLGVAMGNAGPGVAVVADEVTATNDDDGVALVVERLAAQEWARPSAS
ncbi:MAG: HAD family phosphatase [Tessaracoccus sp.]|uniref:Cof-type HAD-IIB family hydrolase n=1 Tax=Tessaracoccus sp. TaxID=1971211 RepID=UPI001EC83FC1|nr:HAD family hydrolase [Tessaracoccus sp.]MBK7819676.1 HAD family phosphatase [Tessaracoccus sp.]